jgi:cytochrome subunit of sulfide dehydrogenase
MMSRAARALAGLAAAAGATLAAAQSPAPPAFGEPNLSPNGVRSMAANCAACHGTGGRAVAGSPVASLAGKSRDEIVQSMAQFKSGAKPATVMHQIAKGFGDAEIAALAEYFSKQRR